MTDSDKPLVEEAMRMMREGNSEGADRIIDIVTSRKDPVAYGKDGYTDEHDPRADNARRHSAEGQIVDACWLTVHTNPAAPYRCKLVRVIGEMAAGGKHLVTVKHPGSEDVILATGYNGDPGKYDDRIIHTPGQDLILDGHGKPPALGPYAVFLSRGGEIVSDEVCSLQLPFGHHICYFIEFEAR